MLCQLATSNYKYICTHSSTPGAAKGAVAYTTEAEHACPRPSSGIRTRVRVTVSHIDYMYARMYVHPRGPKFNRNESFLEPM